MPYVEQFPEYQDPTLTSEQIDQINTRINLDCFSNEHGTRQDGWMAATYCRDADLVIPELVGWTNAKIIGANLLTGYFADGAMGEVSEALHDDFLDGLQGESPYVQGLFEGLKLSHNRVECVDVEEDDPTMSKIAELASDDWGWTRALIRVDGLDFDGRLARFSEDMQPTIDVVRQREVTKRRNLATILLDISGDPSFAPGRKGKVVHIEGELHRTAQWLTSIGLDAAHTVTSKSYPDPHFEVITLAMESRSVPEVNLARSLMRRHFARTAANALMDAVASGADPGRFDMAELVQRHAHMHTLDDLRRVGNSHSMSERQRVTDEVIARGVSN